jgi:hypothetical protein
MFPAGKIDFIQDFHFEHRYTLARLKIAMRTLATEWRAKRERPR